VRTGVIVGVTLLVALAFPFLAVWAGRRMHPSSDPILLVSRAHRLSGPESFAVSTALAKGDALADARLRAAVVALGRLGLERADRERTQLRRWRPWIVGVGLSAVGWAGWRIAHGDLGGLVSLGQWSVLLGVSIRSTRTRRRQLESAVARNSDDAAA
jgi:hypothetical protein